MAPTGSRECAEEVGAWPVEDFDALVQRRLALRAGHAAWRDQARREHALRRVVDLVAWPAGLTCPIGRLREAWVAHRYGVDAVAAGGTVAAGPGSLVLGRRLRRAIVLYEANADHRPPGWPDRGPAALCALAGQRKAATLAGDVARLLVLAKGMRAVALERDVRRLDRARRRAAHRLAVRPAASLRFRVGGRPRWETAEQRRGRVRDAVLLSGGNPGAWPNAEAARSHLAALTAQRGGEPSLAERDRFGELDGNGARAHRYHAQLARGEWPTPALIDRAL